MNAPPKPYPNFPLFAGQNGQWRKDVRVAGGKPKPFYFGPWASDPQGKQAVLEWLAREAGIRAGVDHLRTAVVGPALTVVDLLRQVLTGKEADYKKDKIAPETFRGYIDTFNEFGAWLGNTALFTSLGPDVFGKYRLHLEGRKLGPDQIAGTIRRIKAGFRYAEGKGWVASIPRFGEDFKQPATDPDAKSVVAMRQGQTYVEKAIWTGAEIDYIISHTKHKQLVAVILLAANCGIGMADLARFRWEHIEGSRLTMRRGKTGVKREAYLWRRTREALEAVRTLPQSVKAIEKDGAKALVFITNRGLPIVRVYEQTDKDTGRVKNLSVSSSVDQTFRLAVNAAKLAGAIPAASKHTFYGLRHTCYTYAENSADLNATNRTVGHSLYGQGKVYKHRAFPMKRLKKVAVLVKHKLWPKAKVPAMKLVG